MAALAQRPSGKRLNHQRRIPMAALEESRRRLLGEIRRLERATSFENLFNNIETIIGGIKGIGELTVYDTALRIGAKLNLEPVHVFLHAVTRLGARKLGIGLSGKFIPVERVPRPLRQLKAREIEDVLCIYKEHIGSGKVFRGSES